MAVLTDICRIGWFKPGGDEWMCFTKRFIVPAEPAYSELKLTSDGVCAVWINGEFVEGHIGRMPNRVLRVELTRFLQKGENDIRLLCGSHYFQKSAVEIFSRRGAWFSDVAAELTVQTAEGNVRVVTNGEWTCSSDLGTAPAEVLSEINTADYDRFWRHAALYGDGRSDVVPSQILHTAGDEYAEYLSEGNGESLVPRVIREDGAGTLYDFGRVEVGYVVLSCESDFDFEAELLFDYTESPDDFLPEAKRRRTIADLAVRRGMKAGGDSVQLVRRRACRYLLVRVPAGVRITGCSMKKSVLPAAHKGWFSCSDPLLNRIWRVSLHTLEVNKHQEYESCPRNEMKFFSGDGVVAALTDYYAFGERTLADASLACTELAEAVGIRHDPHSRNDGLWDYPALRILMAYHHYLFFGDVEFVRHYWKDLTDCLIWLIGKAGADGLIYQYPMYFDVFFSQSDSVDYTSSFDRLGRKTYLNALYYECLRVMSELADKTGDSRGAEWRRLSEEVRQSVNQLLWDDDKGAYVDDCFPGVVIQDANVFAVLTGLAPDDRTDRALDTLRRSNHSPHGCRLFDSGMEHTRKGRQTISPLMCAYEAQARFLRGDAAQALDLIRRCWGTMLDKGAGTFWEFAPDDPVKRWEVPSHAWSAGPGYLLPAYACGIRPAAPGFAKLLFAPSGALDDFSCVVPTPRGYVAARCRTENARKSYVLTLPDSVPAEVNVAPEDTVQIIRY